MDVESLSGHSSTVDSSGEKFNLAEFFAVELSPILRHTLNSLLGDLWQSVVPKEPWTCHDILSIIVSHWKVLFAHSMNQAVLSHAKFGLKYLATRPKRKSKEQAASQKEQVESNDFALALTAILNYFGIKVPTFEQEI